MYRSNSTSATHIAGVFVDDTASHGHTPLMLATSRGFNSMVQLLVSHRADVNAADDNGFTPLIYAVAGQHYSTVDYLLAQKANFKHKDKLGRTALHWAILMKADDIVGLLKRAKADTLAEDLLGYTPGDMWADYPVFTYRANIKTPNGFISDEVAKLLTLTLWRKRHWSV